VTPGPDLRAFEPEKRPMLIDIHVHARNSRPIFRKHPKERPLAHEIIDMMDRHGIDAAVVLCACSPEQRTFFDTTEDIVETCRRFADRLIPFCGLDPRMVANSPDSDFRPMLRAYKEAGVKGVGEYIPNVPFDDPLNMNLFGQVEEAGLPLTFHIAPALGGYYGVYDELGLPRLERVLQTFPGLKLLGHSQPFWAEISADVDDQARRGYPTGQVRPGRVVQLMRRYGNLYGDLSAGSGCNAITRDPAYGIAFLEEFQDRLLFGTDICFADQELPIVDFFRKLRGEKLISAEALEKISWRNAARLLGLDIQGNRVQP